jgi:hypothetical protein
MDLGRTVDYLETRPDIDTRKLPFYGVGMGAAHGVRLVAVDARFKAAVFSSVGLMANQPAETDSWNFAPRFHIPVPLVNGRNDFFFPVDTNQKPLFEALGTREPDKKHILYDRGHRTLVTRPDLIGEVLDWFDPIWDRSPPKIESGLGAPRIHGELLKLGIELACCHSARSESKTTARRPARHNLSSALSPSFEVRSSGLTLTSSGQPPSSGLP